jgi:hypothetical protein
LKESLETGKHSARQSYIEFELSKPDVHDYHDDAANRRGFLQSLRRFGGGVLTSQAFGQQKPRLG